MSTVKILKGVYRFCEKSNEDRSMEIGDICILVQDDGDNIPMYFNPKWDGGYQYAHKEHMELIGVFESDQEGC